MLVDRIVKETADISRDFLDMSWWLDEGETITKVVSQTVMLGAYGWSDAPYPLQGGDMPYDPFPLIIQSAVVTTDGAQLEVFVNEGSPGLAYTCQFVLDGSSKRRVTIEMGVQVTGVPFGSLGSGPLPSYLAVTISDTPPIPAQCGQLWFDSKNPELYVYYCDPTSSEWVIATGDLGSSGDTAPDGVFLPLTGGTVAFLQIATSSLVWTDSAPARLFNVHNAWTGASTLPSAVDLNRILTVNSISAAPGVFGGGGYVTALNLESQTGGAASTGGRIALNVLQRQTASTGNFVSGGAYNGVGAAFLAVADFNEGGTNFNPGFHTGSVFGINAGVALRNTATYFSEIAAVEFNVAVHAGASVFVKYGIAVVKEAADAVSGAAGLDSALAFSDQLGAQPWDYGILFGNEGGQWAFDANATLMGVRLNTSQGSVGVIGTAKWVMDFLPMTTTGGLLRGTGFSIENTGITRIGYGALKPDAAGMLIDTDGKQAVSATIANGGSNYVSGVYWPDVNGNVWHIDSVGAGGNVTGVTLTKAVVTGSQPTPIALAPQPYLLQATGAQLAVTYASGTRLMLQPSGGQIASGLLINAANDAAAATAGVQINQWYRNGSVMMQRVA